MGWVAILTPWWGSRKPILMVLCGASGSLVTSDSSPPAESSPACRPPEHGSQCRLRVGAVTRLLCGCGGSYLQGLHSGPRCPQHCVWARISLARAGSQLGSLKFPAWDSLSAQTLNPAVPGEGVWTEQSSR